MEALLAENEALRREVWALRQQLEQQRSRGPTRVTSGSAPVLTLQEVEGWCQAMARHPAWGSLRVGPPGGLRGLVEELRLQWWNPALSLEEELNRHNPGLGSELAAALRGPHSRGRWAVRAAFAFYGPRAVEWLSEEPLRVVGHPHRKPHPQPKPQPPHGEPFYENYYLNSTRDPASDAQNAFHTWLKSAPPRGPKIRVQLYRLKDLHITCHHCGTESVREVQKGVDVGIATRIVKMAAKGSLGVRRPGQPLHGSAVLRRQRDLVGGPASGD